MKKKIGGINDEGVKTIWKGAGRADAGGDHVDRVDVNLLGQLLGDMVSFGSGDMFAGYSFDVSFRRDNDECALAGYDWILHFYDSGNRAENCRSS